MKVLYSQLPYLKNEQVVPNSSPQKVVPSQTSHITINQKNVKTANSQVLHLRFIKL